MCGDAVLNPGEECDDGNLVDDDGCSSTCEIEFFERDYACGEGCLETTIISVSVPLLHTNVITYSFNKTTDDTCDVSHFVLFDIPNCTEVTSVTSYPPGCATEVNIPCDSGGDPNCNNVGHCSDDWTNFIGRPLKVDVWGNNCSVTIDFAHNLTFKEAQFGIKGGRSCSNCTVLVPEGCYEPPQIFPEFACWWDYGNTTCAAIYNYSLVDAIIAIVPKGVRNSLYPMALPDTDNTPVIFTSYGQNMGHSAYWNCQVYPWQMWEVDGEAANASTSNSAKMCEDCNNNSIPDPVDVELGTSHDCNQNCIPDECEISADNNTNGVPDECELQNKVPPRPSDDHPPWEPGVIIVIIALILCLGVSCCAIFVGWGDECEDEEDEKRRRECEKRRRDPLWADSGANSALMGTKTRGGRRGPIGIGVTKVHTDADHSETDGHRKKT